MEMWKEFSIENDSPCEDAVWLRVVTPLVHWYRIVGGDVRSESPWFAYHLNCNYFVINKLEEEGEVKWTSTLL